MKYQGYEWEDRSAIFNRMNYRYLITHWKDIFFNEDQKARLHTSAIEIDKLNKHFSSKCTHLKYFEEDK